MPAASVQTKSAPGGTGGAVSVTQSSRPAAQTGVSSTVQAAQVATLKALRSRGGGGTPIGNFLGNAGSDISHIVTGTPALVAQVGKTIAAGPARVYSAAAGGLRGGGAPRRSIGRPVR